MSRKFEAIDLMKLKALGSANGWNKFLTECLETNDINKLVKIRYQIAAGMDDLVKQKLNTEEMSIWFIRLNKSIEDTAKKIIKKVHPLPQDNPLSDHSLISIEVKRKRDHELQLFLKRSAY